MAAKKPAKKAAKSASKAAKKVVKKSVDEGVPARKAHAPARKAKKAPAPKKKERKRLAQRESIETFKRRCALEDGCEGQSRRKVRKRRSQ